VPPTVAAAEGPSTTVAIVGAGPAGLVAAHVLQRAGVPFVVFERLTRAELESRAAKAGAIEYRTVELLRSVDIADSVLEFDVTNGRCEFRTPDERVVFDYGAMTGGRPHFVYPQHLMVGALCDALLAAGGEVRFGCTIGGVDQYDEGVTLTLTDESVVRCEVVAGCDGARSAIAAAMPDVEVVEETPPVRLLAVLGNTAPLEGHTIYAAHPRGYAGQMRRSPDVTRFYLEVPSTDTLADWPESRIRDEVATRLLEHERLGGVSFIEPSLVDLRMRMSTPMQQGRLFLAGDAAHLVTPAGGKGMNLAIQDAIELAQGVIERFGPNRDPGRLARYSETRLPAIWRTQAFSRWMLRMMMSGSDQRGPASQMAFGAGLKRGWVSSLQHDPLLAKWFAHAYAGVDPA
jgi:p-hydroxybenzoate 3-monooxygenase